MINKKEKASLSGSRGQSLALGVGLSIALLAKANQGDFWSEIHII